MPGLPGLLNILKLHNWLATAQWQAFVNMRKKKKKINKTCINFLQYNRMLKIFYFIILNIAKFD